MTNYIKSLQKRRSIYSIGNDVSLSEAELESTIFDAIKETPSAFNSQSSRAVILFDNAHHALWTIVENELKPLTPEENFPQTQAKLASFAAGKGTILFFEDTDVIASLQEQFKLYAANFPLWSEQSTGMAQHSVWTALAEKEIGATIQHYNPLIDEKVAEKWNIPASWRLTGQMPFGSIKAPAGDKEYMSDTERFRTFN